MHFAFIHMNHGWLKWYVKFSISYTYCQVIFDNFDFVVLLNLLFLCTGWNSAYKFMNIPHIFLLKDRWPWLMLIYLWTTKVPFSPSCFFYEEFNPFYLVSSLNEQAFFFRQCIPVLSCSTLLRICSLNFSTWCFL